MLVSELYSMYITCNRPRQDFHRGLQKILSSKLSSLSFCQDLIGSFICTQNTKIVGLGLLHFTHLFSWSPFSQGFLHKMKHFSPPLDHYSNTQTVNPMAAVGLMCRLLSENVSSLLFSIDNWWCV